MTWGSPGPTWMTGAVCNGLLGSSCIPTGRKFISWWQGLPSLLSASKAAENGNKQSLTMRFPSCDLFTSPATSNLTSSEKPPVIQVCRDFPATGSQCPGCQKEYLHSGVLVALSAWRSRVWWAQKGLWGSSSSLGPETSFQRFPFLFLTTLCPGITKVVFWNLYRPPLFWDVLTQ